jgi:c-di-GMP-binding flagellar brake protein YcgR
MDGFNKYLNIADEIDIMIFKTNGQSLTLSTFVYDVTSDSRMILSNPIKEGTLFPLEKSYTYYFRFYVENSGMYLFKGVLIDRIKFDNLPSIIIQLESDIKRVQRRKFYRVSFLSFGHFLFEKRLSDAQIAATREKMLKKFKSESEFVIDEIIYEKIAFDTADLSGGGLRIQTHTEFDLGEFIKGEFKINESWVTFKGEVIRCEKKDHNRFEVGIKFLELDSNTQSKIVAYVFEVERNLIKKGLM